MGRFYRDIRSADRGSGDSSTSHLNTRSPDPNVRRYDPKIASVPLNFDRDVKNYASKAENSGSARSFLQQIASVEVGTRTSQRLMRRNLSPVDDCARENQKRGAGHRISPPRPAPRTEPIGVQPTQAVQKRTPATLRRPAREEGVLFAQHSRSLFRNRRGKKEFCPGGTRLSAANPG
jgi:hypothetical protein